MTNSIISLGVVLFAFAMLTGVLLAPIAFLAGSVFHGWGTSSTLEWSAEAVRRVFAGSVRRQLMRKVNRQSHIGVDKSRQHLSVSRGVGGTGRCHDPDRAWRRPVQGGGRRREGLSPQRGSAEPGF